MSSTNSTAASLQPEHTLMFQEAADAANVVARQLTENKDILASAVERIKAFNPRAIVTCARGSSDHAATYGKYLFESRLGLLTSSAALSVTSVYNAKQKLDGVLYIAISQSGKSPDLLASVAQAKEAGALTLAFVNVEDSPLAQMVDIVIPLRAGVEKSVAATKSYLSTLSAILSLVTNWTGDEGLKAALASLPDAMRNAWTQDWQSAVNTLTDARNLFVIGRGVGFAAAQEAALKLKETCGLHAEAFSAAEVKHGPMAIVNQGFPVLVFGQQDQTIDSTNSLVEDFASRDAAVMVANEGYTGKGALPVVTGIDSVIAPLLAVQSFYKMANALSIARGYNPDQPPHLRKVTETV